MEDPIIISSQSKNLIVKETSICKKRSINGERDYNMKMLKKTELPKSKRQS
jgi:uncharacterized protein YjfI (DUF2170 family)